MPPFRRKTLVLIGAQGVGRRSLKNKLIMSDQARYGTTIPCECPRVPRQRPCPPPASLSPPPIPVPTSITVPGTAQPSWHRGSAAPGCGCGIAARGHPCGLWVPPGWDPGAGGWH